MAYTPPDASVPRSVGPAHPRRRQGGAGPNQWLQPGNAYGHDPLHHQAWWQQHGWSLNAGGDRFRRTRLQPASGIGLPQHNLQPGSLGGSSVPPRSVGPYHQGPRSEGPVSRGPGGAAGAGPMPVQTGQGGLPLDPYFEAGRRQLEDALQAQLGQFGPAREQALAAQGLGEARLGTNEGNDQRSLIGQMAARGIFGSGIQAQDQGNLATNYMRQRQDLTNQTAGQLSDIASGEAGARGDYSSGLQQLLLDSANRQAQSQYTVNPAGNTRTRARRRRRRGR